MTHALLLLSVALADVAPADRFLVTDRLAVGIATDGSLCNNRVPVVDGDGLGLLWDPDGPEGSVPIGSDFLMPGEPLEAWVVTGTAGETTFELVNGSPEWSGGLTFTWDDPVDNGWSTWIHGTATADVLSVETWIEIPWGQDLVRTTMAFTALTDLGDLAVARVADPDPDFEALGSYNTTNVSGDDHAAASSAWDGRTLALATRSGTGAVCRNCRTPAEVLAAAGASGTGDERIAVAASLGPLATGTVATVEFVYALAMTPDAAIDLAVTTADLDDHDGDGVTAAGGDCDDRDPSTAPGLPESPDGVDQDCDGSVDEDTATSDDDGDGFTEADGDCDDGDATVYPGAAAVEGVDDADCDGLAETGWPPDGARDEGVTHGEIRGCAAPGTRPGGGLLLALLLPLALLRRRSP